MENVIKSLLNDYDKNSIWKVFTVKLRILNLSYVYTYELYVFGTMKKLLF